MPKQRKKRGETYNDQFKAVLAKLREIFDCPCGQRLRSILEIEVDRLRKLGKLAVLDKVVLKSNRMISATTDRKMKQQKRGVAPFKSKSGSKLDSLLKRKIHIRLAVWDVSLGGCIEADLW